ncbi:MAG: YcgN family cysteine cluster protein [Glaciecola sp.]
MSKKTPYSADLLASKFWQHKSLNDMSNAEWEAVCDGCARCCLHKFIDDEAQEEAFTPTDTINDGEEILYTNIACYLLNDKTCGCTQYQKRNELVPDCVMLTKDNLNDIFFMPPSCSYRRLHEGKGLAHWHPLLNKGKKSKMHQLGITVRNRVVSEDDVNMDDFEDYIVSWPLEALDDNA